MKRQNIFLNGDNLSAVVLIIGFIAGALVALAGSILTSTYPIWEQIGYIPDGFVAITGYNMDVSSELRLYIQTMTDNLEYICHTSLFQTSNCERPKQIDRVVNDNSNCGTVVLATPPPPGIVVTQMEIHPCLYDAQIQINIITLKNGSIWKWQKQIRSYMEPIDTILKIFYLVVGGFAGTILAAIVGEIVVIKRRRRNRLN